MRDSRQLVALELFTIIILCVLATWSVRPLLEEWGLFQAFAKNGLGYILSIYSLTAMRPLTLVPSAMQWLSGAGQPVGVGIVAGLLLVARYFIVRWAVTPLLDLSARWIFATIATTLIGWPGLWLARFSSAQVSSVCFFAVLGFCVRINRRPSIIHAAGAAACILIMLMFYQALALAVLAIPLLALWIPEGGENSIKGRLLRMIRVGWPLFAGFLLYVLYCMIAYASVAGIYEVGLLGRPDNHITLAWVWTNIRTAYGTVFLGNNLYLSSLILILGCIMVYDKQLAYKPVSLISVFSLCMLLLLSLPLLSLTYMDIGHLRDPERVLFPVSVGFCLIALPICYIFQRSIGVDAQIQRALVLVLALLISSAHSAIEVRRDWDFQERAILQVRDIIRSTGSTSIIIRDETGLLGDVYSFLGPAMTNALAVYGTQADVTICTPNAIDRLHSKAKRYPIPTTPRCEDLPSSRDGRMILHTTSIDGDLRIQR
jgi:hypothetical protein